jgi:16S rRNA C1402 (ribose-2'-O) methylase RsmI
LSRNKIGNSNQFEEYAQKSIDRIEDILNELGDSAELCIASNLTNFNGTVRTLKISEWRENAYDLGKIPAVFLIGVSQ